jgi:hypothetical protein
MALQCDQIISYLSHDPSNKKYSVLVFLDGAFKIFL